jgi:hypothetical protein
LHHESAKKRGKNYFSSHTKKKHLKFSSFETKNKSSSCIFRVKKLKFHDLDIASCYFLTQHHVIVVYFYHQLIMFVLQKCKIVLDHFSSSVDCADSHVWNKIFLLFYFFLNYFFFLHPAMNFPLNLIRDELPSCCWMIWFWFIKS